MRLDGKVVLVTGAASGIGHGIAKRYVEAGARVAIADLNADGGERDCGCQNGDRRRHVTHSWHMSFALPSLDRSCSPQ